MNQKGFSNIIVLVIVLIIAGVTGYIFFQENHIPTNQPSRQDISGTFQAVGGCGNIYVYQTGSGGDIGISVDADKDSLNLSTTGKTFRIEEANTDDLRVELRVGENVGYLYCNDALDPNQPPYKTLRGTNGKVTISISEIDEFQPEWNRNYTATVVLRDVHFVDENGNNSDMFIDELIFSDVRVGWLPG